MRSPLLAFSLFVLSGLAPAHAADAIVAIKNFDFAMDVTVTPGSTVTWRNLYGVSHTVVSTDGLFRSPALDQNDTFSFKFDHPGVYKYLCSIHPRMRAIVTVK